MRDRLTVFDYRLCQSIIDNRFYSIEFRIIDNQFTPLTNFIKLFHQQNPQHDDENHTICAQEKVCRVRSLEPLQSVDFLLDLETLEVVKLWFMRLERAVNLVLTSVCTCLALLNTHNISISYILLTKTMPPHHCLKLASKLGRMEDQDVLWSANWPF